MAKFPVTGPRTADAALTAADAAKLRKVSMDLAQIALDIAGIADPTPICDGANAIISVARGDWLGAGLSLVSIVPYVGDLAKAGKFPKYLKSVETAIQLAQQSPAAAKILTPVIVRVKQALDLLPDAGGQALSTLRKRVDDFLGQSRTAKAVRAALPDISKQFSFRKFESNGYLYHEAKGRLGVPGKVKTHRSGSAQSALSKGMGDDAGHLIGNRFGAPGGAENLGLQNWRANRYGTYKNLENHWATQLKNGGGVEVQIRDVFKKGESRPFARKVEWTEISPSGVATKKDLTFMNAHTDRSRAMQDIAPSVLTPQSNNVINVDFVTGQRL
ncbi:DNA/RNA non-specific endonuclease [Fuerstiella marisgermanici]|uniref:Type VII secretion system protein EssD-like domain-containing protein n=1 Tax=Fuerstiella marisgermanici TaxID=1891926 RepID=A0A1P8WAY0_9PLAN|nr:DNA/RNA non-specific endonuclease [Fuerstiella marisgermanici]APZ91186.1 hypothetical protein Fuma_00772 [Fuerstiella marisgermanici]